MIDANVQPHHHFCCEDCGTIIDINWETFSNLPVDSLPPGLHAKSYEVIVRGKCNYHNCHQA